MPIGGRKSYSYRITKDKRKKEYFIHNEWIDSRVIDGLNKLHGNDLLDSFYKNQMEQYPDKKKLYTEIEKFRSLLIEGLIDFKDESTTT